MSDSSDEEDDDLHPLLSNLNINIISSAKFTDSYIQQCRDNYLSFHNITQIIHPRRYLFLHHPPKTILHNVSGIFNAGINAILGPSGSGKTSLINILAGRNAKGFTGIVTFSGDRIPHNFSRLSGFVTSGDILPSFLSVRESIMFSAQLRLPTSVSYQEKENKVNQVISELDLESCSESRIGCVKHRGISGGERKRTGIAMELIVSPGIIFLDEPTTGLDAATAMTVVEILHRISRHGRVIIMSIHQPRYSIFKLFDSVTLLSRGELVYSGPARTVVPYFTSVLGLQCPHHNNPADFIVDKIIDHEQEEDIAHEISLEGGGFRNPLFLKYKSSPEYNNLQAALQPILQQALYLPVAKMPQHAVNFFWQMLFVSGRSIKLLRSDTSVLFGVITSVCIALVVGAIFFQLGDDVKGQRDRTGALFVAQANVAFLSSSALESFIHRRALFIHERTSGFYSVLTYFLTTVIFDLLPLRFIPTIISCPIIYYMIGLRSGRDKFLFFLLTMVLVAFASTGQVFAISAMFKAYNVAYAVLLMIITISVLFGGFLVSLNDVTKWVFWLQYVSIFRYGFNAFMWNELEGVAYCDDGGNSTLVNETCYVRCCETFQNCNGVCGDVLLSDRDFDQFDVWWNIYALAALGLIFMLLSLTSLYYVTRNRKIGLIFFK